MIALGVMIRSVPTSHDSLSSRSKVPSVTLGFWVIKIFATTLGETAGDSVSMSWLGETTTTATGWGYLIGTAIFLVPLLFLVLMQVRARRFFHANAVCENRTP